jgi:hypothetical protein
MCDAAMKPWTCSFKAQPQDSQQRRAPGQGQGPGGRACGSASGTGRSTGGWRRARAPPNRAPQARTAQLVAPAYRARLRQRSHDAAGDARRRTYTRCTSTSSCCRSRRGLCTDVPPDGRLGISGIGFRDEGISHVTASIGVQDSRNHRGAAAGGGRRARVPAGVDEASDVLSKIELLPTRGPA